MRKGLSPLVNKVSTAASAPVIAGMRLRAGRAGSGKGAGPNDRQAISTARAAEAHGPTLVRRDSAYGTRAVIGACLRHDAEFSLVMTRNKAVQRAIAVIAETAWTPVALSRGGTRPDTGAWISDAGSSRPPTPPSRAPPEWVASSTVEYESGMIVVSGASWPSD